MKNSQAQPRHPIDRQSKENCHQQGLYPAHLSCYASAGPGRGVFHLEPSRTLQGCALRPVLQQATTPPGQMETPWAHQQALATPSNFQSHLLMMELRPHLGKIHRHPPALAQDWESGLRLALRLRHHTALPVTSMDNRSFASWWGAELRSQSESDRCFLRVMLETQ